MLGGGGAVLGLLSAPFLLGGGGGSKRPAPLFPGPQGGPAHGLHPRFVVAEIWADKGDGGGGGVPMGLGHNLLLRFPILGSSKMEISETDFFDTPTIQNDQISYIKHVLAPRCVFSWLLCRRKRGACRGGHGRLNSTRPTSPPLDLCTYASGR